MLGFSPRASRSISFKVVVVVVVDRVGVVCGVVVLVLLVVGVGYVDVNNV